MPQEHESYENIDAFTGGVQPDGLKNKSDIKVLICFLLSNGSQPLSRKDLTDIFRSILGGVGETLNRREKNFFPSHTSIISFISLSKEQ